MTAVTKLNPPLSPPQLLQQALASNAGIDVIERLLTAKERWETNEARKAFNVAIAAFKANAPKILKTNEVSFGSGRTSYKHEDLAAMLAIVDPVLAEHGLWVRWKVLVTEGKMVRVTCVLGHNEGHSEEPAMLEAAPDTSGSKNPIQAIGSTVSYLQRYTMKAALGLAAAKDDDGRAGGGTPSGVISETQSDALNALLLKAPKGTVDKLLKKAQAASVSDILAVHYDSCVRYVEKQTKEAAQ